MKSNTKTKDSTQQEIENRIGIFLRTAGDKDGGRERRRQRKEVQLLQNGNSNQLREAETEGTNN